MGCGPRHFRGHRRAPGALLPLLALFGSLLLATALIPSAAALKATSPNRCTDNKDKAKRLDLRVKGEKTFGYFALPERRPKGLVVFAHGFPQSSITSRSTLREIARQAGAVAVAMDFRHQGTDLNPDSPTYGLAPGWRVIEGAADSIAAARKMMRRCEALKKLPVVAYGRSMGANATAIALARSAERPGGRPLFDYWFVNAGATDIVSLYKVAVALGDSNPELALIAAAMEEEFGGTYEERPEVYERHSPINLGPEIAASGLKGAVIVVASDDGAYGWNRTMFDRLREVTVPTQFFTVKPVGGPVGHGNQTDLSHPVMRTAFDRLAAFFNHRIRPRCVQGQEFEVNSASGAITPDPASAAC